jgi:tRNA (cytidine/uridine-2'-O-)-methyltransferase
VGQPLKKCAVGGPEQEPRRVEVESPNRAQVGKQGRVFQQVISDGMLVITQGRHHANRFVKHEMNVLPQQHLFALDDDGKGQAGGRDFEARVAQDAAVGGPRLLQANFAIVDQRARHRLGDIEVAGEQLMQSRHGGAMVLRGSPRWRILEPANSGMPPEEPPKGPVREPVQPAALHIALVEPEIAWNTGNVGRTSLAVGAHLHLIEPLGFSLEDRQVRRAGLDYWPRVRLRVWPNWEAFAEVLPGLGEPFFFTSGAGRTHWEPRYPRKTVLVFGRESVGLPQPLLAANAAATVRIPMHDEALRSLNLSTAAALASYEVIRQWGGFASLPDGAAAANLGAGRPPT